MNIRGLFECVFPPGYRPHSNFLYLIQARHNNFISIIQTQVIQYALHFKMGTENLGELGGNKSKATLFCLKQG